MLTDSRDLREDQAELVLSFKEPANKGLPASDFVDSEPTTFLGFQ
jgi:hypothetical protein